MTEVEHARLWWNKFYPEGLANYWRLIEKGMDDNIKFVKRWAK